MYYILGGVPPEDLDSLKALSSSALHREMVYYLSKVTFLFLMFVFYYFIFTFFFYTSLTR